MRGFLGNSVEGPPCAWGMRGVVRYLRGYTTLMPLKTVEIPFVQGMGESADKKVGGAQALRRLEGCRITRDGRIAPRPLYETLGRTVPGGATITVHDVTSLDGQLFALGDVFGDGRSTDLFRYSDEAGWTSAAPGSTTRFLPFLTGLQDVPLPPGLRRLRGPAKCHVGSLYVGVVTRQAGANIGTQQMRLTVIERATRKVIATETIARGTLSPLAVAITGNATGEKLFLFASDGSTGSDDVNVYEYDVGTDTDITLIHSAVLGGAVSGMQLSATAGAVTVACLVTHGSGMSMITMLQTGATPVVTALGGAVAHGGGVLGYSGSINSLGTDLESYHGVAEATSGNTLAIGRLLTSTVDASTSLVVHTSDAIGGGVTINSLPTTGMGGMNGSGTALFPVAYQLTTAEHVQYANAFATGGGSISANAAGLPFGSCDTVGGLFNLSGDTASTEPDVIGVVTMNPATNFVSSSTALIAPSTGSQDRRGYAEAVFDELSCSGQLFSLGTGGMHSDAAGTELWMPVNKLNDFNEIFPGLVVAEVGGRRRFAAVNGELFMTGAAPMVFDGAILHEVGFLSRPVVEPAVTSTTTSSLDPADTYSFQAYWAYVDWRGRVTYSAPSLVETITGDNAYELTITSPMTHRSRISTDGYPRPTVYLRAYRSEGNGSLLYFDVEDHQDAELEESMLGVVSDTLFSEQSDSSLIQGGFWESNETVHTAPVPNSTSVETGHPQSATLIAVGDNRVLLAGLKDRTKAQVSKPFTAGEVVSFAGPGSVSYLNYFISCPEEITAVFALDERFYLCSRDSIYVVPGQGPDRNGNGEYAPVQKLPAAGGCANPESVVETPEGVVLDISGRLSLVPRGGGAPIWIGEPIRDTYVGRTVVSSHLDKGSYEAVWVLDNQTSIGYDLRNKQWSTEVFGSSRVDTVAVSEHGGLRVVVGSDGKIYREDLDSTDAGVYTLLTGDIALAGQLGWAELDKISIVGTYRSDTSVQVHVSVDGGNSFQITQSAQSVTGLDDGDTFSLDFTVDTNRQASHHQIRIICNKSSGGSGGLELTALRLTGIPLPSTRRTLTS